MKPETPSIALIGCGRMGSALLRGWLEFRTASEFLIVDPAGLPAEFANDGRIRFSKNIPDSLGSEAVIIAVKPQMMEQTCRDLASALPARCLVISIAAGRTIASFNGAFGLGRAIVRAMPNTPAAIGKGITAAVTGPGVTAEQKKLSEKILRATGDFLWIEDENLMDAVTALSGSGPAYVYLLMEILENAGVKTGLPRETAKRLARTTVTGSAALAEFDAGTPPSRLRENVTSPGGTTEAALKILMSGELQSIFDRALAAAAARGKVLSRQ